MKFSILTLLSFILISGLLLSCEKDLNKVPVANAGDVANTKLPADSVLLTGTGTDADGKVVGYLWSKVSGPGAPVIMNSGSASTWISDLKAGEYIFQLMVTDEEGATGLDTVLVTVLPADTITLNINPSENQTEVHIWGNNTNKEQSGINSSEIGGVAWTHLGDDIAMRAALKFDLSNIPSTATIISAKLTLYSNPTPINGVSDRANSGTDNSLLIQQITSPWNPVSVTWINQPIATASNEIVIPHTSEAFLDLVDIDVTDFVSNMVTNNTNYGFLIRLKTESIYTSRIFASSKYSDEAKHPKLEILYTP